MKILVLTPLWKRPEIFRLYLESLSRLFMSYPDMEAAFILSPDDPRFIELGEELLTTDHYPIIERNTPFGKKKNTGFRVAKGLEWDYLLELNSDSIVNCRLLELYRPYMDKGVPFFGLNNLYAIEYHTRKCIFIPEYNSDRHRGIPNYEVMSFGAGQMLSREAADKMDKLWTDELNEGMDTNKIKHLRRAGIPEVVVDCGETPMIVDIKTNTTITHFKMLERMAEKEVSYEWVSKQIGYDFISP